MSDFKLSSTDKIVLVTLVNVPNSTPALADIFREISDSFINVDMICQTAPYKEVIDLSFTIGEADLTKILAVVGQLKKKYEGLATEISTGNCKFIVNSELFKTQSGLAARLFKVLADNDLQIKLITTSDDEISILLDNNYFDKINSVLQQEFSA